MNGLATVCLFLLIYFPKQIFIFAIVSEASDLMIGAHPLTKKSDPSPEAKEHIIDIMVKGNVATREQIITYKYICFFFFILY